MVSLPLSLCVCVCARGCVCVCVFVRVGGWACACVGGVRSSNSNRIIPSDYRILLLLKMPIPNLYTWLCDDLQVNMDKYGQIWMLYACMFIIIETIVSMKTRHVSKVIDVFQRTCSCLLDSWEKKHQVPITSLSLHWAIYLHKPVYISAGQGSSSSEHTKCTYPILFIITFVCLSVPLTVFWCT